MTHRRTPTNTQTYSLDDSDRIIERDSERDRQTDRERDRQADRQRERETERETETESEREREKGASSTPRCSCVKKNSSPLRLPSPLVRATNTAMWSVSLL